ILEEARSLSESLPASRRAKVLAELGDAYLRGDRIDNARDTFASAAQLDAGMASQAIQEAACLVDYSAEHCDRAVQLAQSEGGAPDSGVGHSGSNEGSPLGLLEEGDRAFAARDYDRAIALYREALQSDLLPAQQSEAYGHLGEAYYASGQYEEAIAAFQTRIDLYEADPTSRGAFPVDIRAALHASDRFDIGKAHFQLGQYERAERELAIAARDLDNFLVGGDRFGDSALGDLTDIAIRDADIIAVYDLWQRALVAQNKPLEALNVAERSRARVLDEQIARRFSDSDSVPVSDRRQLQTTARDLDITLVNYSLVRDIHLERDGDAQAIALHVWAIAPNGEIHFEAIALDDFDLEMAIERTLFVTGTGRYGDERQRLHEFLIQPISNYLPDTPDRTVVILPDESLYLVPFAALQDADGTYLIEKHPLAIAPSIPFLQRAWQNRRSPSSWQNALVAGNPVMPKVAIAPGEAPVQLAPLPFAEDEAKAIAQLLDVEPLLGGAATEPSVTERFATADIIHLATHGEFNARDGLDSWIALGAAGNEDGLLTAADIWSQFAASGTPRLQADLVVLSACVTGRGTLSGDGVIGLS
ncbi:MAG: CHAT domain-containing protein, partial [Cyanobacteria bacterium J06639_1]